MLLFCSDAASQQIVTSESFIYCIQIDSSCCVSFFFLFEIYLLYALLFATAYPNIGYTFVSIKKTKNIRHDGARKPIASVSPHLFPSLFSLSM